MRSPFLLVPAALLAAALGGHGAAASQAAEVLTPERAIALAMEHHPQLEAAGYAVEAAAADKRMAGSGYLPRIDLQVNGARSTNPVFVFASKLGQGVFGMEDFAIDALNDPDPFSNWAKQVNLGWSLWNAGRTGLGSKAATYGVEAANHERLRTEDVVALGALQAFWNAVLADQMLLVARDGEKAAEANVELTTAQVEEGLAVPSDRMSAEVRLAEIRETRIRVEQMGHVSRASLRQALGLDEDRSYVLAAPDVVARAPEGSLEERIEEALGLRDDLQSVDRRALQADLGRKMARSHHYPEVGLGAQYEANDSNLFGASGTNWTVGLSVRVPLYAGGETGGRKARAAADRARVASMRRAMAEGIRLEVSAAWAEQASASERLGVAQTALESASESLRIVRERYAEGLAVIVELLGAEAALTQAKANVVQAQRDVAVSHAVLDVASGRSIHITSNHFEESAQ